MCTVDDEKGPVGLRALTINTYQTMLLPPPQSARGVGAGL